MSFRQKSEEVVDAFVSKQRAHLWTVLPTLLTAESLTLNIKARNKLLSEL